MHGREIASDATGSERADNGKVLLEQRRRTALDRLNSELSDYRDCRVVYDAKHTEQLSVPADKIDPSSLEDFLFDDDAVYGFFVAVQYAAETNPSGKVNRKMFSKTLHRSYQKLTLLKIKHLDELIRLHLHYGLPLTDLWNMFKNCRTVTDVDQ